MASTSPNFRLSSVFALTRPRPSASRAFSLRLPKQLSLSPPTPPTPLPPTCQPQFRPYGQTRYQRIASAPTPDSGPLLSRRPDRALPTLRPSYTWLKTLPLFALVITLSALAIFNYQKSSSSVVSGTLYALRVNGRAREILGDEIYFASKVPWISGELNQLHGVIDLSFWVRGTKGKGRCRFRSVRRRRMGYVSLLKRFLFSSYFLYG